MSDFKLMFNDAHARGEINPARTLYRHWDYILRANNDQPVYWGLNHGAGSLSRRTTEDQKHAINYWPLTLRPNGDFYFIRPFADRGRNHLRDHSFLGWGMVASRFQWVVDLRKPRCWYGESLGSDHYVLQDLITTGWYRDPKWLRLVWSSEHDNWIITAAPGRTPMQRDTARYLESYEALRQRRVRRAQGLPGTPKVSDRADRVRVDGKLLTLDEAASHVAVHFDLLAPAKRYTTERSRRAHEHDHVAFPVRP